MGRVALPIDERLGEIVDVVQGGKNLVLVAEPGAGKTTRVPSALLDLVSREAGQQTEVIVLQPRRLATRLAATRVASERGDKLGGLVGYQVRFEERTSAATRLRFMTEAILLRRLVSDPELSNVDVVVFDEFHERSLAADIGLALVRRLQTTTRPDLRIVVMSATLDAARVASFLSAETKHVAGRAFAVDISYAPPDLTRLRDSGGRARAEAEASHIAQVVRGAVSDSASGDVLVFLPGAAEIRRAMDALERKMGPGVEVVMLHGDLPPKEQDRAIRKTDHRKVILSTNVAETSVTIEGVTTVVDSGLARIARHSPWSGMSTLSVEKVSQASAVQRAGRAGRVREGRAIRLYSEHDFRSRPDHDEPEISRADLAELLLMLLYRGEDPSAFPFFEAPPDAARERALSLLERLGYWAFGKNGSRLLTELGRDAAGLPVHPRRARIVQEARTRGVSARGCLLAALIGEREIVRSHRVRARGSADYESDVVGSSDLIDRIERFESAEFEDFSGSALRAYDLDRGAVTWVRRSRDQLLRVVEKGAEIGASLADEEEALSLSVLAGFPDRVGKRRKPRSNQVRFADAGAGELSPLSVVKEAEFLVAVQADVRAGKTLIRQASAIEPEWLLELFGDRLEEREDFVFDPKVQRVERVSALYYEQLAIDESRSPAEPSEEATRVLSAALADAGIGSVWELKPLEAWLSRAAFAKQCGLPIEASMDALLKELCAGCVSFSDLGAFSPIDLLEAKMSPDARRDLDRVAPSFVALPGRMRVPVEYPAGREPFIESRIQDFFGLAEGPTIGGGATRVPLVLHLLAPNRRAVQITKDLVGFWERHYPEIRRELKRRYHRHHWPDDPTTASPDDPSRRRGRK